MKKIELVISESIKKGKWVDISYKNSKNSITYYWIAVRDIDLKKKFLFVSIFNDKKSINSLDGIIKFDNILSAKILEFTTYDTPRQLIRKIENNPDDAKWLKYEFFNNNILRYYLKCSEFDNDPFQKDTFLIDGIDKDVLLNNKNLVLNDKQERQVLNYIKKYDSNRKKGEVNYFILSFLSIEENEKKYIVLYYDVRFNPACKMLTINDIPRVNQSFLIKGKKHSLGSYIDIDPQEFCYNICNNLDDFLTEYTELIRANLRYNELINQMPEFMILQRNLGANLMPTYNIIEEKIKSGKLDFPLKAFFGSSNRFGFRRKEPSIVVYDDKVNIDQMRVIYNSMKYPITYVQGPPGTGKTQTILNVILSAFFNSRTVLVCSSNNKPIDGILEKLSFSYEKDDIPFPYLRLGNRGEVAKATLRILDLYNHKYKININEEEIDNIKSKTDAENKDLLRFLELYEKKKDLSIQIKSAERLFNSIDNSSNHLYQNVKSQLDLLMEEYGKIPYISNNDVLELVTTVSQDKSFKLYMYLESIKFVKKLRNSRYSNLINICKIENEEDRVTAFNKWCSSDDNIKLLVNIFPIIFTTNISASRLGSAHHSFDLVIMDEAGQCNAATALLPIARARQLLLVGDTNQLRPVVVLEQTINDYLKDEYSISDDYDYSRYSILDIMKMHDKISKDIMLTYHYRCARKIIDFSNKRFYNGKLNLDYLSSEGNLTLINVQNMNSKLRNENYEEARAIIGYIKRNHLKKATIITPFKNQQVLINSMLKDNNISGISCGTIHQIQGGENDTIIISTSISPKTSKKTFEWIKNNSEITNVAVTRAKENLVVVSDLGALDKLSLDKNDDLYNLVKYVSHNGKCVVPPNDSFTIQIGKSNGSKFEDMFFKSLSHFCTVNNMFQAKRNVKLCDLFSDDPVISKSNMEFDIVLYVVDGSDLIPKIAIELQGGEHFGDLNRERCDKKKVDICREKGITLLEIPNSFAKSYEIIKGLILSSCGQKYEQLELF